MKVKDKVLVVTGGGNGIGRQIVLNLLSRGARVAAVDINKAALEETVRLSADHKNELTIHQVDITDRKSVENFADAIIVRHGAIDGLVNNAGIIQPFVSLNSVDYDTIDRVMGVNFYGTLYMIKAFLPHLLTRPEAHITNLSSMGGFFPVSGQTIYGASKAAIKLLTEGLYTELKKTKVGVSVVFPGGVGTDIVKNSGVEMSRKMDDMQKSIKLLTPKKAAVIIVNGIEKNRYRIFAGTDSALLNIIYKLSPKKAVELFDHFMSSVLAEK
jgi:NAD(P)-dependent dehydrogenase (short-subunit alcohol dehydrogenase family)